jgi:drug/metabolite transporter (DMT)-like permease
MSNIQARQRPVSYAVPALVAGALAIGTSPILVRLSELQPTATAFWRVALAVPLLVLMARANGGPQTGSVRAVQPMSETRDQMGLALAGVFLAADLVCLHWSLRYTSVANSILFLNFAPFFVAGLSWIFYREAITISLTVSLAIAVFGMMALVGGQSAVSEQPLYGDFLAVLAGAFYGGYLFVIARCRRRLPTSTIMTRSSAWCAVALLPTTVAMGERLLPVSPRGGLVLFALAAITHAGGQGLIAYALRYLPAASSAATLMLQPVVAAVAAWAIFAEALGPRQILGAAIVLIGICLCHVGLQAKRDDDAPRSGI